jgi:ABC-type transport system substrate-binding protein
LLAAAGYPSGVPEKLASELWLVANARYQRHAEAIQADLRAVGIPVKLRPAVLSQYLTGYRSEAGCWFGGWYPDLPDAGNFLEPVLHSKNVRPGRSPNAARYRNLRFDALLDRARTMPTGSARDALYRQAEDILLEDLPWIPLFYEAETRYSAPGVRGVRVHPVWRQILTGITRAG